MRGSGVQVTHAAPLSLNSPRSGLAPRSATFAAVLSGTRRIRVTAVSAMARLKFQPRQNCYSKETRWVFRETSHALRKVDGMRYDFALRPDRRGWMGRDLLGGARCRYASRRWNQRVADRFMSIRRLSNGRRRNSRGSASRSCMRKRPRAR
jgi:hypothetical protein